MIKHHLNAVKELAPYIGTMAGLMLYYFVITHYKLPWYWGMLPLVGAFLYCFYKLYRLAYDASVRKG